MKRITAIISAFVLLISFAACGAQSPVASETKKSETTSSIITDAPQTTLSPETSSPNDEQSNVLVVYFSRTGEQYGVGNIDEGNTAIVAKMIAGKTGADSFEILPETDYYPYTYKELTDVAKKEQNDKARPAIKDALPDLSGYETVFIGAPVWWGDWPMIMYTFFEGADLSGKKLIPFSTHEGSGLAGFDKKLASAAPDARVLTGLAIRGADCQNNRESVNTKVTDWLNGLGY